MKRFLLDVNIVLDVALQRAPFFMPAAVLWAAAETKELELLVPAHGVTTVFYVAARERGRSMAQRLVSDLLLLARVAAVDETVLRRALALGWPDLEDAVCAAAAEATLCDVLVTRDAKDFRDSPVLALDPQSAVAVLERRQGSGEVMERPSTAYGPKKARRRR